MRFERRLFLRYVDWPMLAAALLILGFGILVLNSTGQTTDVRADYDARQSVWALVGIAALLFALLVPFRTLDALSIPIYGAVFAFLVYLAVTPSSGAGRWLGFGPIRIQPSEAAKIALVLVMARVLSDRPLGKATLRSYLLPLTLAGAYFLLVLRQPDLGTSLVFGAIVVPMLYWAGLPARAILLALSPLVGMVASTHLFAWILFLFLLFLVLLFLRASPLFLAVALAVNMLVGIAAPILWNELQDYQKTRILTFLDPNHDPLGAGYQIIQSEVAIGSGGFAGKGYLQGTQKGLSFLPEQHTDFIFSVVGEEFGFLGCAFLLSLYLFLFFRMLLIAARTRNRFASLVVVGFFGYLSFQVVVNVGMTLGLVPVTGLPLPLMSYGGSSLITSLFAVGVVLGVGLRRRRY
ncbi:MAG: rod shape-determining protein RodA [Candidatus Eisenbacteria bacterium]|nr:rod shape-determining protein RodA [Candidatus Eisenbacteria bacterium]